MFNLIRGVLSLCVNGFSIERSLFKSQSSILVLKRVQPWKKFMGYLSSVNQPTLRHWTPHTTKWSYASRVYVHELNEKLLHFFKATKKFENFLVTCMFFFFYFFIIIVVVISTQCTNIPSTSIKRFKFKKITRLEVQWFFSLWWFLAVPVPVQKSRKKIYKIFPFFTHTHTQKHIITRNLSECC